MNIAIIVDNPKDAELLETIIKEYFNRKGIPEDINTAYYTGPKEFLEGCGTENYGVIFLDSEFEAASMTGTEAASIIMKRKDSVKIVLLAENDSHMAEALHAHVYDYYIKPLSRDSFSGLMDDIMSGIVNSFDKELVFISEKTKYNMPYDTIAAVKSEAHYLEINTVSGQKYKTRMTFSNISGVLLTDPRFLSTLRGILVNMDYIKEFSESTCILENGLRLPVNVKNCKRIEQVWQAYKFKKWIRE